MEPFEYKTNIQFSDINENNQLTEKGLIRILEESASVHSDCVGYGLNQLSVKHLTWMVLHWKIQIFSRLPWHSEILVKTWPRNFTRISSNRDFEVFDNQNNLIAVATSKWVLIDSQKQSIARISTEITSAYGMNAKSVFDTEVNDKVAEPEDSAYIYEYKIKKRDIDTNHHVNNLYYLDYAYDALPENLWDTNFDNVEVLYKNQTKLGDTIKCFYSYNKDENQHIVTIKSEDLNTIHAIVKLF